MGTYIHFFLGLSILVSSETFVFFAGGFESLSLSFGAAALVLDVDALLLPTGADLAEFVLGFAFFLGSSSSLVSSASDSSSSSIRDRLRDFVTELVDALSFAFVGAFFFGGASSSDDGSNGSLSSSSSEEATARGFFGLEVAVADVDLRGGDDLMMGGTGFDDDGIGLELDLGCFEAASSSLSEDRRTLTLRLEAGVGFA